MWQKLLFCAHSSTNKGKNRDSSVLFLMLCLCFLLPDDDDHHVHASLASLKGFAFALPYGDFEHWRSEM